MIRRLFSSKDQYGTGCRIAKVLCLHPCSSLLNASTGFRSNFHNSPPPLVTYWIYYSSIMLKNKGCAIYFTVGMSFPLKYLLQLNIFYFKISFTVGISFPLKYLLQWSIFSFRISFTMENHLLWNAFSILKYIFYYENSSTIYLRLFSRMLFLVAPLGYSFYGDHKYPAFMLYH